MSSIFPLWFVEIKSLKWFIISNVCGPFKTHSGTSPTWRPQEVPDLCKGVCRLWSLCTASFHDLSVHITCYPLFVLHSLHLFSVIRMLLFNLKPTQPVRMNTFICVPIQAKVSVSWLQEGLESSCWKRNLTPPCISMWPWWSLGSLTNTKRAEAASYI